MRDESLPTWLVEFAKELSAKFPEIESIWIFGSSGRGDGGNDSDWDVAIVRTYDGDLASWDLHQKLSEIEQEILPKNHQVDLFVEAGGRLIALQGEKGIPRIEISKWRKRGDLKLIWQRGV